MKDSTILKIALLTSILGVIGLYIFSANYNLDTTDISKLNGNMLDNTVKIQGKINMIKNNGETTIIKLRTQEEIDIFVFGNISIEKGREIEVVGKVEDYKGRLEVIADKIIEK